MALTKIVPNEGSDNHLKGSWVLVCSTPDRVKMGAARLSIRRPPLLL